MLLFHRDHGDIDSWIEPHFDISSFLGMENSGNLTFVISVDCLTGMFNDADGNCLIEEFLRHKTWENNNGGAVGGIAPTNKSYSFLICSLTFLEPFFYELLYPSSPSFY